jgi:hypothetical protein
MRKATRQRVRAAIRTRSPARSAHECVRTKTILFCILRFCILREECDESVVLTPFLLADESDGLWPLWSGYEPTQKRSRP